MKLTAYVLSFDIGKIVINFACFNSKGIREDYLTLSHSTSRMPEGGGGARVTPYDGLYGEAPPGRGTFFRLLV